MAVTITYFAHGTTTDNENNLSSGWYDVDLSEKGVKQSIELREQTKEKKFDAVFCSDLKRAVTSAELTWKGMYPIIQDMVNSDNFILFQYRIYHPENSVQKLYN